MLLQTNSYIVPADRRADHARLIRKFRQALSRIGCDQFEVYEQVGPNWSPGASGRYVQIMRFRDRQHQQAVQAAERNDPGSQQIIAEFCDLINFPYQQQHGYFAASFYTSVLPVGPRQLLELPQDEEEESVAQVQELEEPEAEEYRQVDDTAEAGVADETFADEEPAAADELAPEAEEMEMAAAAHELATATPGDAELAEVQLPEPTSDSHEVVLTDVEASGFELPEPSIGEHEVALSDGDIAEAALPEPTNDGHEIAPTGIEAVESEAAESNSSGHEFALDDIDFAEAELPEPSRDHHEAAPASIEAVQSEVAESTGAEHEFALDDFDLAETELPAPTSDFHEISPADVENVEPESPEPKNAELESAPDIDLAELGLAEPTSDYHELTAADVEAVELESTEPAVAEKESASTGMDLADLELGDAESVSHPTIPADNEPVEAELAAQPEHDLPPLEPEALAAIEAGELLPDDAEIPAPSEGEVNSETQEHAVEELVETAAPSSEAAVSDSTEAGAVEAAADDLLFASFLDSLTEEDLTAHENVVQPSADAAPGEAVEAEFAHGTIPSEFDGDLVTADAFAPAEPVAEHPADADAESIPVDEESPEHQSPLDLEPIESEGDSLPDRLSGLEVERLEDHPDHERAALLHDELFVGDLEDPAADPGHRTH